MNNYTPKKTSIFLKFLEATFMVLLDKNNMLIVSRHSIVIGWFARKKPLK